MAVNPDGEDAAEKMVGRRRDRRNGYFARCYWACFVILAGFWLIHWIHPIEAPLWGKLMGLGFMLLVVGSLLNSLGAFDGQLEVRHRTKEMNERLAAIEKLLVARLDRD